MKSLHAWCQPSLTETRESVSRGGPRSKTRSAMLPRPMHALHDDMMMYKSLLSTIRLGIRILIDG